MNVASDSRVTTADAEALAVAARRLARRWNDGELADSIARQLTCSEFADLHHLLALVDPDAATGWLAAHAAGDNSEGDCQHARWLAAHTDTDPAEDDPAEDDAAAADADEPTWQGIPLSFPNGTPDCYDPTDDSAAWMSGYTVTVRHADGTEQSLQVAYETSDGQLAGRAFDDDTDTYGPATTVAYRDAAWIEVP